MRLHGYCTACRRIRLVQVTGIDLALTVARGVPRGICADCEERANECGVLHDDGTHGATRCSLRRGHHGPHGSTTSSRLRGLR